MPDALFDRLFVYGSLRSECDNPHTSQLRDEAMSLGPATVRGSLFRVGAYPGYRPEPDGTVRGQLWQLHHPEKTLAVLDDYEGPDYSRVMVDLESQSGRAWIYLYAGEPDPNRRIASGDFLAS